MTDLTRTDTILLVQEHSLVGKVLGNRYRVLREIGSGGMAWVYLAEDTKENQLVALKVLYPQFGEDLSYIHRFNREAKLASAMTDPHIVRVLDYGADRDIYYLIMEYIEGKDLRQTLEERGPFHWRTALDILDQLATALEHAHQHGIVHRDIKPQNMMLDSAGMLKVLDFGIARVSTLPSLTQSGFIGSPYYVSPEQAMSEDVDIRSDIYSSGIVLYELLSGRIPFDAKSPWSIISQHIATEPARIDLSDDHITENVHQLLSKMIAKAREDRFQTPGELRRAIAATLAGKPIPAYGLDTRPIDGSDKAELADSLYQRALEAIAAQEWTRATDLLHQTLKLNPHHAEAAEKLIEAEHQAVLISNYSAAKRAIAREAWEDSIKHLEAVIEIAPDYNDAQVLLEKSKHIFERDRLTQALTAGYEAGLAHLEAERWAEAVTAFQEVQRLSPGYRRAEQLLAEAEQKQKQAQMLPGPKVSPNHSMPQQNWGRWGVIGAGGLAILVVFFIFGNGNLATSDADGQLKTTYEAAQEAIAANDYRQAIELLEQILERDPNYADVAALRRDLIVALTPEPTPSPIPSPTVTPTPPDALFREMLDEAQAGLALAQWSDTIARLQKIRASEPEFEQASISSLLCDAYLGRGLETLNKVPLSAPGEEGMIKTALIDFEAGIAECPRRVDLAEQAERAQAYLEVFDISENQPGEIIQVLTPIVAADNSYAGKNAKVRLYGAYLSRGDERRDKADIVGALGDYEAALALNVDDPSAAQMRRAELLISLQQPPPASLPPTPQSVATPAVDNNSTPAEVEPTATTQQTEIKYDPPHLLSPDNDAFIVGRFTEVFLEWEGTDQLAEDEYYDVTITYIFADGPKYVGFATKETRLQVLAQDLGVGTAGNDRYYWWVTVRKEQSAPTPDALDLPLSPQSEVRTFIWTLK